MFKTIFLLLVGLVFCHFLRSQEFNDESLRDNFSDLGIIQLPSLEEAIDSAIANSPTIKMHGAFQQKASFELEAYKSEWSKEFALMGETKYGSYGNNFQIDNLSMGYGGGVVVRIPLSLLLGRKDNIRIREQEAIIRDQKKAEEIQYLKIKIAELYNDLVLKERILILGNEAFSNMKVRYQSAQVQFNDDLITLEAYTKIYDFYIKSMVSFENAKAAYKSALYIFEQMTGIEISTE